MKLRVAFLPLMAVTAAMTGVTHGLAVGAAEAEPVAAERRSEPTGGRMGVAIGKDLDAQRKRALERERKLKLRERALAAAEKRLAGTMADAEGTVPEPPPEDTGSERFESLARIYQGMKPKRAAAVFERLELPMQVEVAERMKERSVALLIAYMDPNKAAALTMALAGAPVAKASPVQPAKPGGKEKPDAAG